MKNIFRRERRGKTEIITQDYKYNKIKCKDLKLMEEIRNWLGSYQKFLIILKQIGFGIPVTITPIGVGATFYLSSKEKKNVKTTLIYARNVDTSFQVPKIKIYENGKEYQYYVEEKDENLTAKLFFIKHGNFSTQYPIADTNEDRFVIEKSKATAKLQVICTRVDYKLFDSDMEDFFEKEDITKSNPAKVYVKLKKFYDMCKEAICVIRIQKEEDIYEYSFQNGKIKMYGISLKLGLGQVTKVYDNGSWNWHDNKERVSVEVLLTSEKKYNYFLENVGSASSEISIGIKDIENSIKESKDVLSKLQTQLETE